MASILCIGGITYDLYFSGNLPVVQKNFKLTVGSKYPVSTFAHHVGGGAINTAIGLSKSKHKISILSVLGETEYLPIQKQLLQKVGVDYSLCPVLKDYYNISTILLSNSGERSIINYEQEGQQLFFDKLHTSTASNKDVVYMANLADVPLKERALFLYEIKRHNSEVVRVVNIGIADCRKHNESLDLLAQAEAIIMNTTEFCELMQLDEDTVDFATFVLPLDHVLSSRLLILTQGKQGSYAYSENVIYHQKALPVEDIVDVTGAGDAFTAGFIEAYASHKHLEECLYNGAKHSAYIITVMGSHEDVGIG
jgi:sugar/nucleoside kinase (ribokinase family)